MTTNPDILSPEAMLRMISDEDPDESTVVGAAFKAIELGRPVLGTEISAKKTVEQTINQIELLLSGVASAVKGLRGQTGADVGNKILSLSGGVRVHVRRGEFVEKPTRANFVYFWKHELPEILRNHVRGLERDLRAAKEQHEVAKEAWWTTRAIVALMNAPLSGREKMQMVTRVLNEEALQEAVSAADATGDPDAVSKLLTEQAGDSCNSEGT
jgi:hypothetical protein